MATLTEGWAALEAQARRRIFGFTLTVVLLTACAAGLHVIPWQNDVQWETLLESGAALLALIVGVNALVRYYSTQTDSFLYLGVGFLGAAVLDAYHAAVISDYFREITAGLSPALSEWSWVASRLYLSFWLWLSILTVLREWRFRAAPVYICAGLMVCGCVLLIGVLPALQQASLPLLLLVGGTPAVLFLLALLGYLYKGDWKHDHFEHWLVYALIVSVMTQLLFSPISDHAESAPLDLTHLLKEISYFLILNGLMVSTYFLFRQVDLNKRELALSNSALRDSETRVRAVLNTVSEGIVMINEQGGIESVNPAAQTIFGYRLEELLGRNINIFMPEPHRSAHNGYLQRYIQTGEVNIIGKSRELRGLRRNGDVFPMELSVNELWIGGERKFVGVVRDITPRQRARQALLESTRIRQAILDSANLSIIATDPQGVITSFNRAAERMLGYRADEVIGKQTPAIIHDVDEVVRRAQLLSKELGYAIEPGFEVFVAKTRLGLADENTWTYIRKDGARFPVLLSVTAIHDEQDHITGFLGIAADITERQKIDRMKNEFISVVSHELRTPLTSIRGSLGLLAGGVAGVLPDPMRSLIDIACNNSERLVRLINDILDIEKIEAGKMEFRMQPTELMPVVEQAIQANKGFADTHNVRLELRASAPVWVNVDRDRLMQVLVNLLSNAIKFSPGGSAVEVAVSEQAGSVRVTVQDHGPGIPMEFQTRIFQKFAQADGSDTRASGGTGLGLSICKALVERMSGQIGFASTPGQGAQFYFALPVVQAPALVPMAAAEAPGGAASVLVCEDDADIAFLLKCMLEKAGYHVDVAPGAAAARDCLRQKHYRAMTLDLMLPDQGGLTLLRELRDDAATRSLPIIVVSAVAAEGKRELNGAAIGIVDWLDKPIDQSRLLTAVARVAAQREGPARILHVEDDADLRQVVANVLAGSAEVEGVASLAEAAAAVRARTFDLILLDLGLPDGEGLDLLRVLDQTGSNTPVVVFSARDYAGDLAGHLAAVMVKSCTSNQRLLDTIRDILARTRPSSNDAITKPRGTEL